MIRTFIKRGVCAFFLLTGLLAVSALAETVGQEIEHASQLNSQASELYQKGRYQEAIKLLQQSLIINESVLGLEHDLTAYSLNNLAVVYDALGYYDQALPLHQRALAIRVKIFGPDHALTATSLNNLAMLYKSLGRYEQALPLYQRALVILEKNLGAEHVETAASLDNLASLYEALGQYDKAMPLYLRAKAILEKSFGLAPQYAAQNLTQLAGLNATLGENDKALPLYQRALVIHEEYFGGEHPLTIVSIHNLALQYQSMGQYDKALPLYQRVWAIYKNNPSIEYQRSVSASLNNLAIIYEDFGQFDKALPLLKLALEINEKFLGPTNADTIQSLDNLAVYYGLTGRHDLALPLFQRAYSAALFSRVPEMLKLVQTHLAVAYRKQNKPNAEIFYLKGAVNNMQSIRTESLGLDKQLQRSLLSKNQGIYNRLASLLIDAGRLPEAQQVMTMLKEEEYFEFIQRDVKSDTRSVRMPYSSAEEKVAERLMQLGTEGAALIDQLNKINKQAKLGLTSFI